MYTRFPYAPHTLSLSLLLPAVLGAQPQPIVPQTYYRYFSHTNPVLRRIQPGEVVATKTVDSSGRDFHGDVRHPEQGNPLTGPFFIEGAEPGDAILVHLRRVRLNRDWGYSGLPPGPLRAAAGVHRGPLLRQLQTRPRHPRPFQPGPLGHRPGAAISFACATPPARVSRWSSPPFRCWVASAWPPPAISPPPPAPPAPMAAIWITTR